MAGKVYLGNTPIKKIYVGSTQIKKVYLGSTQVYSSGSEVSYYSGSTFLGMQEFEEGESVLSPSGITPTKSGYTFKGWSLKSNPTFDDRATTLVANGEPMTLYAVFIPSTLQIFHMVVARHEHGYDYPVRPDVNNTRYITSILNDGSVVGNLQTSIYRSVRTDTTTQTLALNLKGEYSRAVVNWRTTSFNAVGDRWANNNLGYNSRTAPTNTSGALSSSSQTPAWAISSSAHCDSNESFVWIYTWIDSITLYA